MKLKIADAGNVTVPAFLALQQKGYTVRCERSPDGTRETWVAENDTTELFADDLVLCHSLFFGLGWLWQSLRCHGRGLPTPQHQPSSNPNF